jgi:hypothetical protein
MKKAARRIFPAIALPLFFLGVSASAQQPKAAGRVMVHAGKLLDVRSGKTLTDQAIVIDGGKIVSVGAAKDANTTGATMSAGTPRNRPGASPSAVSASSGSLRSIATKQASALPARHKRRASSRSATAVTCATSMRRKRAVKSRP